jgi:glycosyltransferase involved in cell wall biosynthesis
MTKVLIISCFFAPYNTIGAVRNTKIAEKLLTLGCDVHVITTDQLPFETGLDSEFPYNRITQTKFIPFPFMGKGKKQSSDTDFELSFMSTLKRKMLAVGNYVLFTLLSIPDKYLGWYPSAMKAIDTLIKETGAPDIIYASASPYTSLIIASAVAKKYNIPWIAEFRDLWSDNHYRPKYKIGQYIEKRTLRNASHIVTVSDNLANKLRKRYQKPISVVYNAFDKYDFTFVKNSHSEKRTRLQIVYTGTLHDEYQNLDPLVNAMRKSKQLQDRYKIFFYGDGFEKVKRKISALKLDHCFEFSSRVNRRLSLEKQCGADILLFLSWNDEKQNGILTGKLFEYIGASRPILAIGERREAASDIIVNNSFGIFTDNEIGIYNFLSSYSSEKFQLGSNRAFERTIQVIKLLEIFEEIAQKKIRST